MTVFTYRLNNIILIVIGTLSIALTVQKTEARTYYDGDCKWPCFYPDSTRKNIFEFMNAWAQKDTNYLNRVLKHLHSNTIKRSEYFLYLSTIEHLTNFWLGVSNDFYGEYTALHDLEPYNAPIQFKEKKVSLEFLDSSIHDILLFKRYPEEHFYRFDYIIISSWGNDSLSSKLIKSMKDSINQEVAMKKYNNNFEVMVLPSLAADYVTEFNFSSKNTLAIEHLLDSLNNTFTDIKSFFQLSFELFHYLNLDINKLPKLTLYPFEIINSENYATKRKNWYKFSYNYFYSPYKFKFFTKENAQEIYLLLNSNKEISDKDVQKTLKKHFKQ